MVQVTLFDRGSRPFSIHSNLLHDNLSEFEFVRDDDGNCHIPYDPDLKVSAFQAFARFLYTGQISRKSSSSANSMEAQMAELVQAYKCADKVGSVYFMDAVTDEIIKVITSRPNPCCINTLVDKLLADLPEDSRVLYEFVCDYVLYFKDLGCGKEDCSIYRELANVQDEIFLHCLGNRASEARGLKNRPHTIEETIMLAVGCREAIRHDDWYELDEYPWKEDRCRYHDHTFLKKECYASMRDGDPDDLE